MQKNIIAVAIVSVLLLVLSQVLSTRPGAGLRPTRLRETKKDVWVTEEAQPFVSRLFTKARSHWCVVVFVISTHLLSPGLFRPWRFPLTFSSRLCAGKIVTHRT